MSNEKALAILVGRMKVEELARLAGIGVEDLVAAVLGRHGNGPTKRAVRDAAPPVVEVEGEDPEPVLEAVDPPTNGVVPFPALGDMAGRATYRQVHFAIDRWLLGNVWEEESHNVSRAAARLEISRRRYRELFARTQSDDTVSGTDALAGRPDTTVPAPALDSLLPKGTYRMIHDEADRWLLGHVLSWTEGNLTHAARHLDVSRKHLREHLARVGMR